MDCCPQAAEASADDDEISIRYADEGVGRFWCIGIVGPEDLGPRIGDGFVDVDRDDSSQYLFRLSEAGALDSIVDRTIHSDSIAVGPVSDRCAYLGGSDRADK